MKVLGRTFDRNDSVGRQYTLLHYKPARIKVLLYDEGELLFPCKLCGLPYQHWLCDDRIWHKLPAVLHNNCLCLSCFTAVRRLMKLLK